MFHAHLRRACENPGTPVRFNTQSGHSLVDTNCQIHTVGSPCIQCTDVHCVEPHWGQHQGDWGEPLVVGLCPAARWGVSHCLRAGWQEGHLRLKNRCWPWAPGILSGQKLDHYQYGHIDLDVDLVLLVGYRVNNGELPKFRLRVFSGTIWKIRAIVCWGRLTVRRSKVVLMVCTSSRKICIGHPQVANCPVHPMSSWGQRGETSIPPAFPLCATKGHVTLAPWWINRSFNAKAV